MMHEDKIYCVLSNELKCFSEFLQHSKVSCLNVVDLCLGETYHSIVIDIDIDYVMC